ncbi:MAG: hypothetical protein ABIB65_03520 [Candidatus Margulisiibacteriota bacterium]
MKIATHPRMKNILILIMTALILSSCSPAPEPKPVPAPVSEPRPAPPARKQVFDQKSSPDSTVITLSFASEPVQLDCGFIRLTGIVEGDNGKSTLLELGGKGFSCIQGEVFEKGYKLAQIKDREVVICSEK